MSLTGVECEACEVRLLEKAAMRNERDAALRRAEAMQAERNGAFEQMRGWQKRAERAEEKADVLQEQWDRGTVDLRASLDAAVRMRDEARAALARYGDRLHAAHATMRRAVERLRDYAELGASSADLAALAAELGGE